MPVTNSLNQKTRKMITRYLQILFVALAFTLMVIVSYRFMSDIERKHLQRNVKDAILNTEANINANMLEPETTLAGFAETIRGMILRGDTAERVQEDIIFINNYVQSNEGTRLMGVIGFYGVFDVFGGKFIAGDADWIPPDDYVPQSRPWYIAAVEADGEVGITDPYTDIAYGEVSITFSRRIFDEDGKPLGIVCLDIKLDRIREIAVGTQFAENGYGFLMSDSMELIAHPEPSMIGMPFHDVQSRIAAYEDELIRNGHVYEVITTDYRGIESIVFIEKLHNGWYMGIVTPKNIYFQSTKKMAVFLTLLGAVLAMALIAILLAILNEIHRESEKSRSMAHWYNSILNAIPLPITVTDANTNWTFINTAVERFLGITLEEALGKPCSNWGAHICNTPDCGIACARRGLTRTYFSYKDFSFQVDVSILRDINYEVMGYIEVVQDITNLKVMAKKQAEAEAANFAKSAFLAKVSHEIRTPMNAILGITEILLRNETLPADIQEALDKIYNSGYLLLGIINDILDLSKIEAGKLELFPVEYDVPSLINDTVNLNVVRYESKPIKFTLQIDEKIPLTLLGDQLRMRQILNNLLSNAFKYTESGEVIMSISLDAQETAAGIMLVFSISDTGQGMSPEQLGRLFEEYTRFNVEANRAVEGAGLGMSITKHLIRLMDGTINVESNPGKGSVFTVRLPQGSVAGSGVFGAELAKNIGKVHYAKTAQTKKTPVVYEYMPYGRILVVDDVETNLYVTKGLLTPYGLSVETASSGFEVIEKIKGGSNWDIIFMDHYMPVMDGIEAVKIIRSMGYTKPIVALTANVITGQAEVFFSNGFDDFISKPIDIRQLNAVLNKLVRDKYPSEIIEAARRIKNNLKNDTNVSSTLSAKTEIEKVFIKDAQKAIDILEAIFGKTDELKNEDIQLYIINVHSMKSALANIGEPELSAAAGKLEEAGRERNISLISEGTQPFLAALREIIVKKRLNIDDETVEDIREDDRVCLIEKLTVLQESCEKYNKKDAKTALAALQQKKWPRQTVELLEKIAEHLLHSEFAEAAKLAEDGKNLNVI